MKIVKTEKIEIEIVDDILCDKCGESCKLRDSSEFGGLIEARVCGGYYSTHLEDGEDFNFSICEKCLFEMFKDFKINPRKG